MIECRNFSIKLGDFELSNISFRVPEGKHFCLMGKTGCGKTTILESICGLRPSSRGEIFIDGINVTNLRPSQRQIGFVPQEGALFSTMTVKEHLSFALKIRRWSRQKIQSRVDELAKLLGITHLLDRRPNGLSGGEKQRVAMGRSLSFYPKVLCMDEPLSALDDHTKEEMYGLIEHIRGNTGVTILHISHNFEEILRLADGVIYIDDGRVVHYSPENYSSLKEHIQSNGRYQLLIDKTQ